MKDHTRIHFSRICALLLCITYAACALLACMQSTAYAELTFSDVGADDGAYSPELSPGADGIEPTLRDVSLYFRMRGENLLVRETRTVSFPLDMSPEQVLIAKLIEGPGPNQLEMTGLFIPGTEVLPPTADGSLLTVTLTSEFLDKPADAPANWQSDPSWKEEVLSRRMMALASIVNTITEETDYTEVLLLVQRDGVDAAGRRITRAEVFPDAPQGLVLAPVSRMEDLILSPYNAASIILDCWWRRDFDRLYRFISERPTETEFQQEMLMINKTLLTFSLRAGVVSDNGQRAVISSDVEYTNAAGYTKSRTFPMQLVHENNLWKMEYDALLRLMEAEQ